jgi:uncharacterized protein YjiS (DUF1127 family)
MHMNDQQMPMPLAADQLDRMNAWWRAARACRQLSQQSAATMWTAARKFLAVLS